MSLNPVFQVGKRNDDVPLPFNKTLCMFCQKAVPQKKTSVGRPTKDDTECFNDIVKTTKEHARYKTGKYQQLQDEINEKTGTLLKSEGYCFHSLPCRNSFNKDKVFIKRKRAAEKAEQEEIHRKQMRPTRVLRTEVDQFDYTKCLFCQEDTDWALHDVTQDSKDLRLKEAFEDSPLALQKFRIRSLSAHDAMAGELKYHQECWNKHINQRLPEHPSTSSSTSRDSTRDNQDIDSENINPDMNEDPDVDNEVRRSRRQSDTSVTKNSEPSLHDSSSEDFDIDPDFTYQSTVNVVKSHSDFDPNVQTMVIAEIMSGIELALSDGQVLTVRNAVEVYQSRMKELGQNDDREYRTLRKMMVRELKKIPDVKLDESIPNQSQRITTSNMEKLILRLAEENCKTDDVFMMKKVANMLNRTTLKFMRENPVNFNGSIESEYSKYPDVLQTFLKWVLAGVRPLHEAVDENINIASRTLSFNVMYNMKTKRQANYKPKHSNKIVSRHRYTPVHQIGMGLALRHMDRNNNVIRLISLYGTSIPDRQCLRWGTIIANSVIDLMVSNDNVYIPPNLVKHVLTMFHIDNIDWQEDTPDGKNTTHMLMICIMQRRTSKPAPLCLKLNPKTSSLTLKDNSFDELSPYNKSSKTKFTRTAGCSVFPSSQILDNKKGNWRHWLTVPCFERLFLRENVERWCSNQPHQQQLDDAHSCLQGETKQFTDAFKELVLPSFGATDSLVTDTNITVTNIFTTPVVPGPASSWSALFTAMMRVKNITAWACGNDRKNCRVARFGLE